MCDFTSGRLEPCKNSLGGVRNMYVMPFVSYGFNQIDVNEGVELITFPETTVYRYELRSNGNNFSEDLQNDDNGASYNQTLTVSLKKIDLATSRELRILNKIELRVIFEDRNGKYWLLGLRNGVTMDYTTSTGGGKSDFNGYNLTFSGAEQYKAPFIENLANTGFIVDGDIVETFNILLESQDDLLQENNDKILLENG